jgi:hypothetical protein
VAKSELFASSWNGLVSLGNIRIVDGLLVNSLQTPEGAHILVIESIQILSGVHQDAWGSVIYKYGIAANTPRVSIGKLFILCLWNH